MKKQLLCVGILAGLGLGATKVSAEATDVTQAVNKTNGTVQLLEDGTPTPPDPSETVAETDGKTTGNAGPLSIDYIPNFLFGQTKVGETVTLTDLNTNPFVQVTDKRGTGAGWTLKLTATKFKNADDTLELRGTTLSIGNINVQAVDSENLSTAPTAASGVSFAATDTGSKVLMTAAQNGGMGSWKGKFKTADDSANSVTLYIPAGNKTGQYTSTLTWSLSNAPE